MTVGLNQSATMTCEGEGSACAASVPVRLVLLMNGAFGVSKPSEAGWKVGVSKSGAYACWCPKHHPPVITAAPSLIEVPH